jgi:hypothetical protein
MLINHLTIQRVTRGHRDRHQMVVGLTTTLYLYNRCLLTLELWEG